MNFSEVIEKQAFALLAEVDPPKGVNTKGFLNAALSIKGRVDALVVTDAAHAFMRMTPLAPSRLLLDHNLDPVMIVNGRDRNRLSFQGDLLSARALGVRNILVKEGQDAAVGDQPMVQSSGDLDLETMLKCASALNDGKDLSGEALDGATDFMVGAALEVSDDVNANQRTAESVPRLGELGVRFVVLGPTYDVNILDLFSRAAEDTGVKVFASIMMLKSVAMVRYLNSLPGVPSIPHEFLKMMMKAPVKAQAGLNIAASFVRDIEARCQGAVLITIGWENRLSEFLDLVGR